MFTFYKQNIEILSILIYLVAYIMALFVAMPFHEFAHAYAARKEGDYTATALKRCTLAPLAHIDIRGMFCFLLIGFGWAKPVPVDERNFKRGKKSKFFVAFAGIFTNLCLGIIFIFLYLLIGKIFPNLYTSSLYGKLLNQFLYSSIMLNFSLAFFNIIPIYPLDGFRIIETFSKYDSKVVKFLKDYSIVLYLILVFSGIYSIYFSYTAGFIIEKLISLFSLILGVK